MFGAGSLMYFPQATKEEKKKKNPGAHGQACPNTVLHLWNRSSTYVLCICMTMYVHFICIYTLLHNLLHLLGLMVRPAPTPLRRGLRVQKST